MAEVLGVVASSIALGTLAGKMAHMTWKLKEFQDQVRAAPNNIAHLLQEMECISLILSQTAKDQAVPIAFQNDACMKQALELCEKAVTELSGLLDDLATIIVAKKRWKKVSGSLKIALRQEELTRLSGKVQTSIRLLSLAQQFHIRTMLQVQPEMIVAQFVSHMQQNPQIRLCYHGLDPTDEPKEKLSVTQKDIPRADYDARMSSESRFRSLIGSFQHKSATVLRRGKLTKEIEATYRPPRWISQVNYHLQACSRISGWQINYQGYLHYSKDHSFSIAIEQGDIATVQKMISDKTAFITDRFGRDEETVLHIAAQSVNVEMMRLLINEGADPLTQNSHGTRPIVELIYPEWGRKPNTTQAIIECYSLLLRNNATDFLEEDLEFFVEDETTELHYLLSQLYLPYSEYPLDYRIRLALNPLIRYEWPIIPDLFELALASNGQITEEMAHWRGESNMTVLHYLSYSVDQFRVCGRFDQTYHLQGILKIMLRFIQAGADLHALTDYEESPLYYLILSIGCPGIIELQRYPMVLREWLRLVESFGIDLVQYGAAEQDLGTFTRLASNDDYRRTVLVTYGPRPCDWILWPCEWTDSYAGDFWNLVENKCLTSDEEVITEAAMPGAWGDD